MQYENSVPNEATAAVQTRAGGWRAKRGEMIHVTVAVVVALFAQAAIGQTSSGDPLGNGMCYFVTLLTGKWAFGLSIVGLAATAGSFIGGVEMNEFMKKMASIFMVICILLAGTAIIRAFANYISPGIATCS